MTDLFRVSIDILKGYQSSTGAFVACPNFPSYRYSWLRDGTFIAFALDCVGEHDASRKFHRWVNSTVARHREKLVRLKAKLVAGEPTLPRDFLAARYLLDGAEPDDDWPNFQLDGHGTWLWGLAEHVTRTGETCLLDELREGILLTLDYLALCWCLPNYSCWEEHGDEVHTSTLACLAGGIDRITQLIGDPGYASLVARIRDHLLRHCLNRGRLTKFSGARDGGLSPIVEQSVRASPASVVGGSVDASLLWVTVPFRLLEPLDPRMARTVEVIERQLVRGCGVHRYPADTYYGGGLWLVLSAFLGWYYCEAGRFKDAESCLAWVEAQADADGLMPEQVGEHLIDPTFVKPWVERWGPVAKPLLWSHAMYLVLETTLRGWRRGVSASCT